VKKAARLAFGALAVLCVSTANALLVRASADESLFVFLSEIRFQTGVGCRKRTGPRIVV